MLRKRVAWNKGLTNETSEGVRKNSESKRVSVKKNWESGVYANRKSNAQKLKENPNWEKSRWKKGREPWNKGTGKSCEYDYNFSEELKHKIRVRDGAKCSVCEARNKRLVVHHIDENKQNNNEDNLITLCQSCHTKEHMYIIKTENRQRGFIDCRGGTSA